MSTTAPSRLSPTSPCCTTWLRGRWTSSGSEKPPGFCWSTGGTSCPACRRGGSPPPGGVPHDRRGVAAGRRPDPGPGTAAAAARGHHRQPGTSAGPARGAPAARERPRAAGITSGGPPRTPPTTPTASSPKRCASCARGNSARSTRHRTMIWNGRVANSAIRPQRSHADCRDRPDEAGPPADHVPAWQGQGLVPLSRRGHTPPRMRGCRCPADWRSPVGDLQT